MQVKGLQESDQKKAIFQEIVLSLGLQLESGRSYDSQNLSQDVK